MCMNNVLVTQSKSMHNSHTTSIQQRVSITLWCLATPCEYCIVAHLFGVALSTVCEIVQDTCRSIVHALLSVYINSPTGESLKRVVDVFEGKWGFPQCVGAIDGCHIPIAAPELNHTDYYNRKGWYFVIIQAIVDHDYLFQDVCVAWP